jgi:hypothetical protein
MIEMENIKKGLRDFTDKADQGMVKTGNPQFDKYLQVIVIIVGLVTTLLGSVSVATSNDILNSLNQEPDRVVYGSYNLTSHKSFNVLVYDDRGGLNTYVGSVNFKGARFGIQWFTTDYLPANDPTEVLNLYGDYTVSAGNSGWLTDPKIEILNVSMSGANLKLGMILGDYLIHTCEWIKADALILQSGISGQIIYDSMNFVNPSITVTAYTPGVSITVKMSGSISYGSGIELIEPFEWTVPSGTTYIALWEYYLAGLLP